MTNKTPIAYYSKHKIPPRGQLTFWLEVPIREMCLGIYNTGATWNLQWILASAPSFMPGLPAVFPCTALDPWLCFGKRPKKPSVQKQQRSLHWFLPPILDSSLACSTHSELLWPFPRIDFGGVTLWNRWLYGKEGITSSTFQQTWSRSSLSQDSMVVCTHSKTCEANLLAFHYI